MVKVLKKLGRRRRKLIRLHRYKIYIYILLNINKLVQTTNKYNYSSITFSSEIWLLSANGGCLCIRTLFPTALEGKCSGRLMILSALAAF
jgi:hypothetical protein